MSGPKSAKRRCLWVAAGISLSAAVAAGQEAIESAPSSRAPVRADGAGQKPAPPHAVKLDRTQWRGVPGVRLPEVDAAALVAEDRLREAEPGVPMRVGVNRSMPEGPVAAWGDGSWERTADGSGRWRLTIESAAAEAVRLHFSRFDLPEGAVLTVSDETGAITEEYTGRGLRDSGAFWSTALAGPIAYVEYAGPVIEGVSPVIEIDEVSHLYRGGLFQNLGGGSSQSDGTVSSALPCHVDPNCQGADTNARDAVARMLFTVPNTGTFLCSGALLNDNDPNTFAGYFLTAHHCISDQPTASTLIAYWFYQTTECGGAIRSLSTVPRSHGADFLVGSSHFGGTDFTLLRLDDDPHEGQGFAAWTTSGVSNGATVMGIHHPGGSYKRYSEGPTTTAQPICCNPLCTDRFIYNDWAPGLGVTEGGSSGSPLFNEDWEVIGQLFGACLFFGTDPGCSNPEDYNNIYGKFSVTYSSISSYLNTITPDDDHEPNDSLTSAAPLAVGGHDLTLVDFDDYFAVTLTETRELSATATFDSSQIDLNLRLLSSGGTELDASNGTGNSESVSASVAAGTYVIHASRTEGRGGDYTLDIATFEANCEPPAAVQAESNPVAKNRYISLVPGNAGIETGLQVTLVSLYRPDPAGGSSSLPDFSAHEGTVRWVGPPQTFPEGTLEEPTFLGAQLQCEPYFRDWGNVGVIHVFGAAVMPNSSYEIHVVGEDCNPSNNGTISGGLPVSTAHWGDVVPPFAPGTEGQPNVHDVTALVDKFRGLETAPTKARAQLQPDVPDPTMPIDVRDVTRAVDAFRGLPFPFSGPAACP